MNEAVFQTLGGLLVGALGIWSVHVSRRGTHPLFLQMVWWLGEEDPTRESMSRGFGYLVGIVAIFGGFLMLLIGSVTILRHFLP